MRFSTSGTKCWGFCFGLQEFSALAFTFPANLFQIKYMSFGKIDDEKKKWKIPFLTEFLEKRGFEPALEMFSGSETVRAREFVQYAFGQIKSLNDSYLQNEWFSKSDADPNVEEKQCELENSEGSTDKDSNKRPELEDNAVGNVEKSTEKIQVAEDSWLDNQFWKTFADSVNQNVVQKLGLPPPENMKWDQFDVLKNFGSLSREIAEASYVQSGLATPSSDAKDEPESSGAIQTSLTDIKKMTQDLLRQTDSILGALMVVNAAVSKLSNEAGLTGKGEDTSIEAKEVIEEEEDSKAVISEQNKLVLNEKEAEEMRELFSTAESAMEAWALLANALGHPTFIKSEFEKICFLDNAETDTQASLIYRSRDVDYHYDPIHIELLYIEILLLVIFLLVRMQVAIWRDLERKRLVVAFRGTEQVGFRISMIRGKSFDFFPG